MKHGFRLLLHTGLTPEQRDRARHIFVTRFIQTNGRYGTGGWDSGSYWRRGQLGYPSKSDGDYDMVIRRMSKKRRIFAAIPRELADKDNEIDWNQCMCSMHLAGTKVSIEFNENDYDLYYETGEIKG